MTSTPPPPPPMQENQVPPTARMASAHQPYNGHVAESRYSLRSIVAQFIIILVISAVAAIVAYSLDSLAYARQESGLLPGLAFDKMSNGLSYCFALTLITLSTIMLLDIRFRKPINNLQNILVGASLVCFYLLMLSFAEHTAFAIAFCISSLMNIALIGWFTHGLMGIGRATATVVGVLVVEYLILLCLLYIGSFALLAGSLILFTLIALAMFFTLRMKIINNEIYIGNPNE